MWRSCLSPCILSRFRSRDSSSDWSRSSLPGNLHQDSRTCPCTPLCQNRTCTGTGLRRSDSSSTLRWCSNWKLSGHRSSPCRRQSHNSRRLASGPRGHTLLRNSTQVGVAGRKAHTLHLGCCWCTRQRTAGSHLRFARSPMCLVLRGDLYRRPPSHPRDRKPRGCSSEGLCRCLLVRSTLVGRGYCCLADSGWQIDTRRCTGSRLSSCTEGQSAAVERPPGRRLRCSLAASHTGREEMLLSGISSDYALFPRKISPLAASFINSLMLGQRNVG
jgi:hypothetical protein